MCVFQSNGEDELLDDSDCKQPKPATVQTCGHEECPAQWVSIKTSPVSKIAFIVALSVPPQEPLHRWL